MTREKCSPTSKVMQVQIPDKILSSIDDLLSYCEANGEFVSKDAPYNLATYLNILTHTEVLHFDLAKSLLSKVQEYIWPEVQLIRLAKWLKMPVDVFELDSLYFENLLILELFIFESFELNKSHEIKKII